VLDVFHEEAHGFRRAVRAADTLLAGKTSRNGQRGLAAGTLDPRKCSSGPR
jgi:hypothetical protein